MNKLSKDDIAILHSAFNKYNSDNTGLLSVMQFTLFLARLSKHVSELKGVEFKTASAVFAIVDKDQDGKISFEEFVGWWALDENIRYSYFTGEKASLIRKAFGLYKKYTSESGGKMTYNQFENMMDELNLKHTEFDFDELDQNNDGLLSFEEFLDWLNWF